MQQSGVCVWSMFSGDSGFGQQLREVSEKYQLALRGKHYSRIFPISFKPFNFHSLTLETRYLHDHIGMGKQMCIKI